MSEEYLTERCMEGLIYLIFLQERTQKEALEYIYNKDYSNININPFKKARDNLLKLNMIKSDGSFRNVSFKSNLSFLGKLFDINQEDLDICLADLEKSEHLARDDKGILRFRFGTNGVKTFIIEYLEKLS